MAISYHPSRIGVKAVYGLLWPIKGLLQIAVIGPFVSVNYTQ